MRLRLLLAALVFFAGLIGITLAIRAVLPADAPDWLTTGAILAGFILSLLLTNKLVNVKGTNFWSLSRAPEPSDQADQEGLLVATRYQANRFFQVEECSDEGSHYFIELHDGSVLYMNGPYLSAYEPHKLFNLIDRPRKFPCTEFVVKRDREDGGVITIQCIGSVLEPEIVTPPFEEEDLQSGMMPLDGDVITTRSYDEMKALRSAGAGTSDHDGPFRDKDLKTT
jgi:hypothetical protein